MFRKLTILFMALTLSWTTVACGSPQVSSPRNPNLTTTSSTPTRLSDGEYPVQQATYDDATGEYSLFLLNTPPGTPATFRTTDLQMAALTEEQINSGQKSYVEIKNGQAVMHLAEDFKIEYVHNVTETQTNSQTGQQETVVVRRETGFWTPFAGALAGQAIGSLLFAPRYYVPPVYQPGGVLRGYGGYGNTYSQAVNRYQTRYQAPPPAVRNRQTLRTTGGLRRSPTTRPTTTTRRTPSNNNSRSTGSGYGSSNLRRSQRSSPSRLNRPSGSGFGSSRSSRPARRSSGGRRRR
ncbi:MAG: hypothetical protein KME06_15150 [Kastovskya adunca ATA6-11-RM4]|jgi:hypothetical protein|nr:hypothetical protein [Kastovskya adunca ATA6-11-RM4]